MKKSLFKTLGILLPILALSLAGCGGSTSESPSEKGPSTDLSSTDGTNKEHGITFSGVEDTTIDLYQEFDLLAGVKAVDGIDGELVVEVIDDDSFTNDFVGSYTITYSAKNSAGEEKTIERTIAVVKGINVLNGNFNYGKAYWTFDKPGGDASISFKNGAATVSAKNAGSEAWSLQLYQTNIVFEANKTYELTFKAKSSTGRSISAGFENVGNNYAMMVSGYQAVTLNPGDDFITYSIYCTPSAPVSNVKAVVYLGRNLDVDMKASKDEPIDVTLDDINVKEVAIDLAKAPRFENADNVRVSTKDQFDALEPVKAFDYNGKDISDKIEIVGEVPVSVSADTGMMLSYRVTDDEGNFGYINRRVAYTIAKENAWNLINEKFDNGSQGWIADVNQTNGTGAASFVASDGKMDIDISSGSNTDWHIQLHQSNISLSANSIYRMTLVAKASAERRVTLEISDPSNNYAKLYTETYNLTTEYQTFTLEYKPTKNYNAKVSLLLGGQGANVVTVDELSNTKIDASEATIDLRDYQPHELINGDFQYGYYSWNKSTNEGADANFTQDVGKVNVEVTSQGHDWHIQLGQSGRVFEAGKTYKISLTASALANTTIKVEVTQDGGGTSVTEIIKQEVSLTTSEDTYTIEFTPTETATNGKLALLLGESELTTISIDSLVVSIVE